MTSKYSINKQIFYRHALSFHLSVYYKEQSSLLDRKIKIKQRTALCPIFNSLWGSASCEVGTGYQSLRFSWIIGQARDQVVPIKADGQTDTHWDDRCQKNDDDSNNTGFVADRACCCGDRVKQRQRQYEHCGKSHWLHLEFRVGNLLACGVLLW